MDFVKYNKGILRAHAGLEPSEQRALKCSLKGKRVEHREGGVVPEPR